MQRLVGRPGVAKRRQRERSQDKDEDLREPHPMYRNHGTDYTLRDARYECAEQPDGGHSGEHAPKKSKPSRPVSMASSSICGG